MKTSKFPLIKDCRQGNCVFHFPQFSKLLPLKFRAALLDSIHGNYSPQNRFTYEQAVKLIDDNRFIEAAELAAESYGYEIYEDMHGGLAVFNPCCR